MDLFSITRFTNSSRNCRVVLTIILLFSLAITVRAQTMGKFMTCDDKKEKCTLDCVLSVHLGELREDKIPTCRTACLEQHRVCINSAEVSAAQDCLEICARKYDGLMVECLRGHSSTTRGTYNKGQDECSIKASEKFDDCSADCYGKDFDMFHGWTPEKEEGSKVNGRKGDRFIIPKQRVERRADGSVNYVSYYK